MLRKWLFAVSLVVVAVAAASVFSDAVLRERVREAEARAADRDSWRRQSRIWKARYEAELDRIDRYEQQVWELRERLETFAGE